MHIFDGSILLFLQCLTFYDTWQVSKLQFIKIEVVITEVISVDFIEFSDIFSIVQNSQILDFDTVYF